ncbi:MAG: HAMP domain-containing histidine kinase [Peptococcaceae bacterium]|nr:HAMP domain-containing histidine kinase [Peptococcaceae bacterium]
MMRRLVLLIQINILFIIIVFTGVLVISEQNVEEAYRDWLITGAPKVGRSLINVQNVAEGLRWPGVEGTRKISLGPGPASQISGMTYDAYIPEEEGFVHIGYFLGEHYVAALKSVPLILLIEIIIVLLGFFPALRSAQKLLQPLRNMTQDTRMLHKQASMPEESRPGPQKNLAILTGDINQLATRQDARLRVNDLELEDLAEAINAMLERVHDSYWQQKQFISDASHELRTPISVIEGYAAILDRWGKNDEKALLESIEAIKNESAHMKELVEQLLFLARGDNDTMVVQWQMLDIMGLAEEVFRGFQVVHEGHEWIFKAEPVQEAVYIRGDEGLLKQTLRILTDNAIRYSPADGEITIEISAQPDNVRIAVQDQGIGISAQDLPRIFDRFFRSESSREKMEGGTGLGLSIAKWIVDKHRGRIEVLSHENIGTRITVELPKNWDGGFE